MFNVELLTSCRVQALTGMGRLADALHASVAAGSVRKVRRFFLANSTWEEARFPPSLTETGAPGFQRCRECWG